MNNPKQNRRSKSGEGRQTEVGGPSNPQQSQEPRFISDQNPHYEPDWNPIPVHNPLVVMDAEESDDEATPSIVKAPPLTKPEFTLPSSGGLTSEEIAMLAHGLTQAIIAARSNPMTTPPLNLAALSSPIPYPPYEEDKTERRAYAAKHGEVRHKTCSIKDSWDP